MNESNTTVEVLLATYNGERFLRQQIDSVLAQTYKPLLILARDDGSRDATPQILAEYAARFPETFRVITGPPTGKAQENFAALLAASTAPYVSFCDQDDVWLPEKIALSMAAMHRLEAAHGTHKPLLTFTDLRVVDGDLNVRHASFWAYQPIQAEAIHSLRRVILQNTVTGNTAVINRTMAELALPIPFEVHVHDWWVALLACAFGAAEPIYEPLVLYRQHGANVTGARLEGRSKGIPRWRNHQKRYEAWREAANMARALLSRFRDRLSPADRKTAELFVRIDESPSAIFRVTNFLRLRPRPFNGFRSLMAMLLVLIDLPRAKQQSAPVNRL